MTNSSHHAAVWLMALAMPLLFPALAPGLPPFHECPPIGADTSCEFLFVIGNSSVTCAGDAKQGPYDGGDDVLVGVTNASCSTVNSMRFTGVPGAAVFGFDGDGLCTYLPLGSGCPFGPTGYEGPHTSFSNISADHNSGNVNFTGGLAPGQTAYFSLEQSILIDCSAFSGFTTIPGISLTPAEATNCLGVTHTVTACILYNCAPLANTAIAFGVTGANTDSGSCLSSPDGCCTFTYTGVNPGVDTITAAATIGGNSVTATVTKVWLTTPPTGISMTPTEATNCVGLAHTVTACVLVDCGPIVNTNIAFSVTGSNTGSGSCLTSPDGCCTFTYTGVNPGVDSITAVATVGATSFTSTVTKVWVNGPLFPVIQCPADIVVSPCTNTPISYTATATDSCCTNPPVVNCTPQSPHLFPLGTTMVQCVATDCSGNSASCTFSVTVLPSPSPVIQCPSNIVVYACSNALVSYTPKATDTCCSSNPLVVFCLPPSPHQFPVGTTPVHCEVTNCLGNTASCDFQVSVLQSNVTPPTILCSSNKIVVPPAFDYRTLTSFSITGSDGVFPYPRLIQASDGLLYGTTEYGGSNGVGTVFKLNTDGTGYTVLHHFSDNAGEGTLPIADLLEGFDGALYGTTAFGGSNNLGTAFRLNTDGTGYTVLHHFSAGGGDGQIPGSALLQGYDGTLYGTTVHGGGSNDMGTVFTMNVDGSGYAVLKAFNGSDGAQPRAGLLLGTDGALYGTTVYGGSNNVGTVYTLGSNGTVYVVLHHFSASGGDGRYPEAGLLEGNNGALYGTTCFGGSSGDGTVFTISKDGSAYAVLKSFAGGDDNEVLSALVEGDDGALYGTTVGGGSNNLGTIFTIQKDGSGFTEVYDFPSNGEDDQDPPGPYAGLVKGSDGAFYGTTPFGGTDGVGSVSRFEWSPPWDFDPPTVIPNDNTDIAIGGFGTTNGCPQVVAQTWTVTDACGNTIICTQLVTVLPPRIPIQFFYTGANQLPVYSVDPHYTLIANPNGGGTKAYVEALRPTSWVLNTVASQWIGPTSNALSVAAGMYIYRLPFNLACTNKVTVSGRWAADDAGHMVLNGTSVPGAVITAPGALSWHTFSITSGFSPGLNNLDFYVTNSIFSPSGLRVEITGGAYCCTNCLFLQCPTNISVVSCTNLGISYSAMVSDSCAASNTVTFTPSSPHVFSPGTVTPVHCQVVDSNGNSASCDFLVTVTRPGVLVGTSVTNGPAPLSVAFNYFDPCFTINITNWNWNFGDGNITNLNSNAGPIHIYNQGSFSPFVITTDTGGINITNALPYTINVQPSFAGWQWLYFNCTNCPQADGNADPDGDGISNTNEFLAGTDPTNSVSAFHITSVVRQSNDLRITWTTAGGFTNAVQATPGDVHGGYNTNFQDISGLLLINGNGDTFTNYLDSGGATSSPSRYYRIRLVP